MEILGLGCLNFKILLLKTSILSKFLIFRSNLFHSWIVEGKFFVEKLMFIVNSAIASQFQAAYGRFHCEGIMLKG